MKTNQDIIFSDHELWKAASLNPDEKRRAQDIIGLIPSGTRKILDAGCGNGVVANMLSAYEIIALDRSTAALDLVQVPKVVGDVTNLQFRDGQFDLTICSEVLEHISYDEYPRALAEVARVSKAHIIVSVPWKQRLEKSQVICPQCNCRFNPHYHMRSFDKQIMTDLFRDQGFAIETLTTSCNKRRHVGLDRLLRGLGMMKFPPQTLCPQCGYQKVSRVAGVSTVATIPGKGARFRKWWPRGLSRPRWWVALYSRSEK